VCNWKEGGGLGLPSSYKAGKVLAENQVVDSALWFFLGCASYRVISSLVLSARSLLLMEQTILNCLNVLSYCDDMYGTFSKMKHGLIRKNRPSEQEYDEMDSDNALRDTWRYMAIYSIINSCPATLRGAIKFNDWDSAMKYLNKIEKGNK
tara:strand:+ start:29865 stop:30314 length:450 start_codon:yes stop_codon:yes gene_type:complete